MCAPGEARCEILRSLVSMGFGVFVVVFCVLPCKIKYYKMTTVGSRVVRAFCK